MSAHAWPKPLPVTRDLEQEAHGWRTNATVLASVIDARMVNRRDVWGAYLPPAHREAGKQHTYTAPGKAWRGRTTLDAWRITRHLRGEGAGHVIGLHSTSADDTSRWGAFDFDAHDAPPREYVAQLADAAVAIVERLADYGAAPLLEDSNGNGGWHVWVYFDEPAPTADVFAWLDALADRARLDFGVSIETYPKQASARGKFGNWLRVPGRHHTRAHWSRVARPGEPWRSGADVLETVRAWPATPVAVIPPASSWPLRSVGTVGSDGGSDMAPTDTPAQRAPIIRAYLRALPNGDAGSGRSDRLFSLARFLRHGVACTDAEALGVLRAWNAGNRPPLEDAKVVTTWQNSAVYASQAFTLRAGERHAA